jgi:hypothetical protein
VTDQADRAGVPPDVLARLRAICLALPEVEEQQAWVGVRWRVRTRTFAHVLTVVDGWPPAYARAAGLVAAPGPTPVLTFRSSGVELDAIGHAGAPWFHAGWGRDAVGLVLDGTVPWDDIAEVLAESWATLAPARLVADLERPPSPPRN